MSVYQAYTSRQQQQMNARPYIIIGNTNADGYPRVVQNVGLAPARVRSMIVEVDGRPPASSAGSIRLARQLDSAQFAALAAPVAIGTTTSTVSRGTVLLPGSTIEVFRTLPGPRAREARRALNDPRVHVRLCDCSVYDDCWRTGPGAEPAQIRACSDDRARVRIGLTARG